MIKFSGNRTEFGQFYGGRLKEFHYELFAQANPTTLKKQLQIYEKYYPELITEHLAAAEILNINPEILFYEDLASFVDVTKRRLNKRNHGCTIFAIRENGKVFVGRNYDWLPIAREFFERYYIEIAGANRYFCFSDESVWRHHTGKNSRKFYMEDALNEHGLYIGLTFSHIEKWNYGLSPSHLIRYIAEHCSTTRQALNAFRRIPCAIPKNFLIADKTGDLAIVEHTAKNFEIIRPDQNGVLVQTNHCLSPKLQKIDPILKHDPKATCFVRFAEANYLIAEQLPNFQYTDLARILRNSHYIYNPETIWTLAFELTEPRLNIYYDTVNGSKHTKFTF